MVSSVPQAMSPNIPYVGVSYMSKSSCGSMPASHHLEKQDGYPRLASPVDAATATPVPSVALRLRVGGIAKIPLRFHTQTPNARDAAGSTCSSLFQGCPSFLWLRSDSTRSFGYTPSSPRSAME